MSTATVISMSDKTDRKVDIRFVRCSLYSNVFPVIKLLFLRGMGFNMFWKCDGYQLGQSPVRIGIEIDKGASD